MAQWKVIAERIELFPHPNGDKLLIGKIGPFQVVVSKDNGYENGQVVVFAPERSELPEEIRGEYVNSMTGESYLTGPNNDRVVARRLRGELSEGATLPLDWVRRKLVENSVVATGGDLPLNWDLSHGLGITKYKPPIPADMLGKLTEAPFVRFAKKHDVEQFRLYQREFVVGEPVNLFEKVHGSQVSITRTEEGGILVASKTSNEDNHCFLYDENNLYWKAVLNSGVLVDLEKLAGEVQVFAEVFPCQKGGFTYGAIEPTLRIFRLLIHGEEISYEYVSGCSTFNGLAELWVPRIWSGPYPENAEELVAHAKGKEQVSGKELHLREGVVLSPAVPRRSSEGFALYVKLINPKFKGSDEDFS